MEKKITAEMVDWVAYRKSIEDAISNEKIWALGGSEFIVELENELECIDNGDYDTILDKYDDVFEYYLK